MELAATDKIVAGMYSFYFLWPLHQPAMVAAFAHPAGLTEDHFRNVKSRSILQFNPIL